MDVIEIARTILRRWYVMLPVLLVTAGVVYAVIATAESEYETTGSFLLTDASLVGGAGEPGSLQTPVTPSVLAEIAEGDDVRARVRDGGGSADYEVGVAEDGLIRVEATGQSQQGTAQTVQLVLAEIERVLEERQESAGLPETRRISVEILTSPTTAQERVVTTPDGGEAVRFFASGSARFLGAANQGTNPYAASLSGTIRVLEEVMVSPQVRREIAAATSRGQYEVAMRQRDTAPIVYVIGRATSPEASVNIFATTVDRLRTELRERQELAGAPPSTLLTFEPLSMPTGAVLVGGELRRPLIVIIGLGLLAAVSLAILVEGLSTRSRRRKRGGAYLQPSGAALLKDGQTTEQQTSQTVGGG